MDFTIFSPCFQKRDQIGHVLLRNGCLEPDRHQREAGGCHFCDLITGDGLRQAALNSDDKIVRSFRFDQARKLTSVLCFDSVTGPAFFHGAIGIEDVGKQRFRWLDPDVRDVRSDLDTAAVDPRGASRIAGVGTAGA